MGFTFQGSSRDASRTFNFCTLKNIFGIEKIFQLFIPLLIILPSKKEKENIYIHENTQISLAIRNGQLSDMSLIELQWVQVGSDETCHKEA